MIRGLHALLFSSDPEATRAFLRDSLGLRGTDVGGGWLIFGVPLAEIGVHPTEEGVPPPGTHEVSLYCDDLRKEVARLKARGVVFTQPIRARSWGLETRFTMPGAIEVQLFQPRYQPPTGGPPRKPRVGTPRKRRTGRG